MNGKLTKDIVLGAITAAIGVFVGAYFESLTSLIGIFILLAILMVITSEVMDNFLHPNNGASNAAFFSIIFFSIGMCVVDPVSGIILGAGVLGMIIYASCVY